MMVSIRCFVAFTMIAASSMSVSQTTSSTTVGGYGELHYNEPDGDRRGELDFSRFVIYLSHTFDQRISFHSEVELEHTRLEAGRNQGGEIALEQAFIDYRLGDSFGMRAGIVLIPVGLINLYHEPPSFNGVERPNVEQVIIPTTWRESGAGVYGSISDGLQYQLYLVAGLDAKGFDASEGLREGRQEAFRSNPVNPSVTGRLDFSPSTGLQLGASFFAGGSSGDNDSIGSALVSLVSGDARYTIGDLSLRSVFALANIGDAQKINAAYGASVADRVYGFYIEAAYNILPLFDHEADQELHLFGRLEHYNTQESTTGFSPLKEYDRTDIVVGATYKPVYNVSFKCDYMFLNNGVNSGALKNTKQFNLGIGYYFY